jgi:hypothetical protein
MPETPKDKRQNEAVDYNVAMGRLMYVVATGAFFIFVYGVQQKSGGAISVGMMTAGASLLAGGLLGFLFGVPHTRAEDAGDGAEDKATSTEAALSSTYRPSTSLEQISDWLTKIIVGVGLVDIRDIAAKILRMSDYIAPGLIRDGTLQQGAKVFALTILVYFSVCGFVFGFLWARLYLPRWFADADSVKRLLSQFELQQQRDAKALAQCYRLLTPTQEGVSISDSDIADAIEHASRPVKVQIFSQARAASEDRNNPDRQSKLKGAIAIFKALIQVDTDDKYHRNYFELSSALRRLKPPDWVGAEQAIEKAIEIRTKMRVGGWKYYEFRRARFRIESDANFANKQPSDVGVAAKIQADLLIAAQADRWLGWLEEGDGIVKEWAKLNNINPPSIA